MQILLSYPCNSFILRYPVLLKLGPTAVNFSTAVKPELFPNKYNLKYSMHGLANKQSSYKILNHGSLNHDILTKTQMA